MDFKRTVTTDVLRFIRHLKRNPLKGEFSVDPLFI